MLSKFFFNSKKAIATKWVSLIIFIFVLVVMFAYINNTDLDNTTSQGIDDLKLLGTIEKCELNYCKLKSCEKEDSCSEKELENWENQKKYFELCEKAKSNENIKELEKLKCGALYAELSKKLKNTNENPDDNKDPINTENPVQDSQKPLTETEVEQKVNKFLSSTFYNNNKQKFENYAKKHNFDVNLIYMIIIKEGGYDKTFEQSVRFECHKYNKNNGILGGVPCTLKNGESFSRVYSETNHKAYLSAASKKPELAFQSSSFGFGQIMGSNLMSYYPTKTPEELYDNLKSTSFQIESFFKYLEKNGMISKLKNKDYQSIARTYNGPAYAQNKYDQDIEKIHETMIG